MLFDAETGSDVLVIIPTRWRNVMAEMLSKAEKVFYLWTNDGRLMEKYIRNQFEIADIFYTELGNHRQLLFCRDKTFSLVQPMMVFEVWMQQKYHLVYRCCCFWVKPCKAFLICQFISSGILYNAYDFQWFSDPAEILKTTM